MAGFIDRDGELLQNMRVWLRIKSLQAGDGTSDGVWFNRVLSLLNDLVEYKRGSEPALIRKDEIIQELREQVEKLERTAHALRQARGSHAGS